MGQNFVAFTVSISSRKMKKHEEYSKKDIVKGIISLYNFENVEFFLNLVFAFVEFGKMI